jgi:hypothetical protein
LAVAVERRLAGLDQVVEGTDPHHHRVEIGAVERDGQIRTFCLLALDVGERGIAQLKRTCR